MLDYRDALLYYKHDELSSGVTYMLPRHIWGLFLFIGSTPGATHAYTHTHIHTYIHTIKTVRTNANATITAAGCHYHFLDCKCTVPYPYHFLGSLEPWNPDTFLQYLSSPRLIGRPPHNSLDPYLSVITAGNQQAGSELRDRLHWQTKSIKSRCH